MIINLAGPPGAGKSTFASRFVLEHLEFKYVPIDVYRIKYKQESLAWHHFTKDIIEHKHVVVESAGISYRLADAFNTETIRRRPIYTVWFTASKPEVLLARVKSRHKREVPINFNYDLHDELMAVTYVMENPQKVAAPIDAVIQTDTCSEKLAYNTVCRYIAWARLQNHGNRRRRKNTFHGVLGGPYAH